MPTYVVEWTYECKGCDLLKTVEKESLYKKDVIGFKEPPCPKCYNWAQHSGVQEKRKMWKIMTCVDKVFFERWFEA